MQITEERKKWVIDLYFNQHKTYTEIAQIEHISPRDIHAIIKEELARRQKYKQQELSSKAYKLFSEGKTPVEVAITLNLREPEVTKLYREYLKLQGLPKFNLIYEEIGEDNIEDFVEFWNRSKERGMGRMHMVKALAIADKELPYLEEKCELLKIENNDLESKKQQSKNELHNLKDEIASSKELLKSYTSSCERKRQESESVNNEISRLEALVTRFKSNNEEYLEIKSTVEDILKNVLTDGKVLLHKAVFSIIETLQNENNTTKNHLISFLAKEAITVSHYRDYKYVSSTSTSSSSGEHKLAQYIEDYKDTILEEAEKLCNRMIKDLTDTIIDNTAFKMMSSPVPSDLPTRLRVHIQSYTYTKEDPEVNDNVNNNDEDDK
jgi:DNA-binding CsgD family transcriptional regulator/predicted RNase H-like nuclease (RuvC/YqgF family)